MVKYYRYMLVVLLAVSASAAAEEQKCLVHQPDGSVEIRYVDIDDEYRARETLQRYLDDHEAVGDVVESCIDRERRFSSSQARQVEIEAPQ